MHGNLLTLSADWNEDRIWRLGKMSSANPVEIASAEYHVARAAAYYQDGLGVEQRWLLREIALELHETMRAKTGRRPSPDTIFAMFFSPGIGRFRLPEKIPVELENEIGAYNGERLALKTELRETLFRLDAERSDGKRAAALKALSEKQWPAARGARGEGRAHPTWTRSRASGNASTPAAANSPGAARANRSLRSRPTGI